MKKEILIFMMAVVGVLPLHAQRIGVEGSYVADLLWQKDHGETATDMISGWNAGVVWEQFLGANRQRPLKDTVTSLWSVETGLGWEMRGGRYGAEWYEEASTCNRFVHYVSVPVRVTRYFKPFAWEEDNPLNKFRLFATCGAKVSVGVLGDYDHHYYLATRAYNPNNPFSDKLSGEDMHRFDAALTLGGGVEWSLFRLKLQYDLPLTNSSADSKPDELYQHNLSVTLGMRFDIRSKRK